jgi:hypothetical protein
MPNLSDAELAAIEQRAELCFKYEDPEALRAQDVADLIAEIRGLWREKRHFTAQIRQLLDRLNAMGETAPDDDADPP